MSICPKSKRCLRAVGRAAVKPTGIPILVILLLLAAPRVHAQMDLDDSIRSLSRISAYGLVVDIESSVGDRSQGLSNKAWRDTLSSRLTREAGSALTLKVDPTNDAHLYVHVNAMGVGDGLVPFSIDVSFIQSVELDSGGRMMAVTWNSGLVGLVSANEVSQILDAGAGIVQEFASDFATSKHLE